MTDYLFEPTAPATIPIIGSDKLYPVNRIFCVGRNYEAHAAEMGAVVDREAPFYFTKSPTTLVMAEGEIAYAPRTENYHYEMELVFALKSGGTNIAEADALSHIYGCAAGLDMTRRDLQNKAKENRKPWDTAKDVDESAVITPLRQMSEVPSVASGRIHLSQNGTVKQDADLSEMALFYIGGIIKHAKSLNAFTNASTNSYKRLIPGYEAPVLLAYSSRNRSASCRIPHVNSPNGKRVEVRFPDATANPYLAFSAMLMAGLDGIQNKIHPGDAMDKDLYDLPAEELAQIPTVCASLREALESLSADRAYLTQGNVFTDDQIDAYIELKMEEVIALEHTPHPVEFQMYYSA